MGLPILVRWHLYIESSPISSCVSPTCSLSSHWRVARILTPPSNLSLRRPDPKQQHYSSASSAHMVRIGELTDEFTQNNMLQAPKELEVGGYIANPNTRKPKQAFIQLNKYIVRSVRRSSFYIGQIIANLWTKEGIADTPISICSYLGYQF